MVATRRLVLFHVEDEAFEVLAFGVVDVYGVILGLMQLVEDAHGASHLRRRREDGETESLFVHCLGAGEGKEDASFTNLLKGFGVESLIALERVLDGTTMLGKSRWVKDNEVVLIFIVFSKFPAAVKADSRQR